LKPVFFATPAAFRRWLARHHAGAVELWVGFHKKGSGRPSITWPQSVDEALCFGWIDGVRKSIDEDSYAIRFTPRTRTSTWSLVNTRRAEELARLGKMMSAGLTAFARRDAEKSGAYSFEQRDAAQLAADETSRFRANTNAWAYFSAQPQGYRKTATWWVVSAKREATRARRLRALMDDSAAGRRVGPLRRE
jgi:uncharacterized protein YdeI (YjbR/CyaY-like superfamily)